MFSYQPVIEPDKIYHRSGWKDVVTCLQQNSNNKARIKLIDLVDNYYSNLRNPLINHLWVGFIHHVPNVPKSESPDLEQLLNDRRFRRDLFYCRCIFTLSDYLKTYLQTRLPNIKIISIHHPINNIFPLFDPDKFINNHSKSLIFIGNQDRRYDRFYRLTTDYQKKWLSGKPLSKSKELLCNQLKLGLFPDDIIINQLNDDEYDLILQKNIVMVDMFNCSANNTIIECIIRTTPILLNPVGGATEYLGLDYPLYFNNLEELSCKLKDVNLLISAHYYLKSLDKKFLTFESFISTINQTISQMPLDKKHYYTGNKSIQTNQLQMPKKNRLLMSNQLNLNLIVNK